MVKYSFLGVDLQYDFSREGGEFYAPRKSVVFAREVLLPYLRKHGLKTAEIVSDYRQPRPGDARNICRPSEWGYESEVPDDARIGDPWVKCMPSPIWIRENGGNPDAKPGIPYQDPAAFTGWLNRNVGGPKDIDSVILYGLTLDCCVLCTGQELAFRGYDVKVLYEGTDTRSGSREEKDHQLSNPPIIFWMKPIHWKELVASI
ncbi:MAG: hypothetical protein ACMUIG_01655 [Thermoplasmatota archaeon]